MSRRRRRAGEAGFALPTVLFVMLGAFAIGSVAAIASIGAQKGTARDHNTKTSIAAAEAGVSQALLRYNRVRADDTTSSCLVVVGDSTMFEQEPGADGWCDGVEGQTTDGSQFTYWVRPTENQIEIVSQGSADAVTRRVEVTAISKPQPGLNPFEHATLIGLTQITLDSNAHAEAHVATNGDVTMQAGSSLCGDAQVGEPPHAVAGGSHTSPSSGCTSSGSVAHAPPEVLLPPVNQGDVLENNSNWRFFTEDPIHGQKHRVCWDGADGNGAASGDCGGRELNLKQNTAVTLGGSNYSFCKLTMSSNSTLYTAAGAKVNIFFDSPESCGYDDGETQLLMQQNSSIKPSAGDPTNIALLFVGSESEPPLDTNIQLRSNTHANAICGQNFVIYAPRTDITLDSNSHYCGAIAGKDIHLNSNAQVRTSNLAQEFNLPNTEHWSPYWRDRFVECSGAAAWPPNNAC